MILTDFTTADDQTPSNQWFVGYRNQEFYLRRDLGGFIFLHDLKWRYRVPFTLQDLESIWNEPSRIADILNSYCIGDRDTAVRIWWEGMGTRLLRVKRKEGSSYERIIWNPFRVDSFIAGELRRHPELNTMTRSNRLAVIDELRFEGNDRFPSALNIEYSEAQALLYLRRPGVFEKMIRERPRGLGVDFEPIWERIFLQIRRLHSSTTFEVSARQTFDDLLWCSALSLSAAERERLGIGGMSFNRGQRSTLDRTYQQTRWRFQ